MALPTTGLTAHFDASSAADLYTTFVSGGPHTGTPVDGSAVAVWDHAAGANLIFKQESSNPLPIWRASTPLLPLPCVDFDFPVSVHQRLALTNNAGTAQPLSAVISSSAFTLLISFYAETITSAANSYTAHALIGDILGYWGAFLSLVGGVPKVLAYNYDGTQDYVRLDCSAGASHVLMMRHQSGTLYASLDGGAESSVASGNTSNVTGNVHLGIALSAGLYGRLGEVALYNTALTGTDLTDAVSYFTSKWLAPPTKRGSTIFGVDTDVTVTRAVAFGLDGNTNIHDEEGKLKVFGDFEVTGETTVEDLIVNGTFALPADSVTNAELADMAQATLKGRAAGAGTGNPVDLTGTQATVILDALVGDAGAGGTKGLAPAPAAGDAAAAKFLKADGTWAAPASSGGAYKPLTTGAEPLEFVSDGAGDVIMVAFTP
jgi:hypothetical protein